jgi:Clp amino terminal domain, pathogenicity island component
MFQGDSPDLKGVLILAPSIARELRDDYVGSEHLLAAVARQRGQVAEILAEHRADVGAIRRILRDHRPPGGATAAADQELLSALGIEISPLLPSSVSNSTTALHSHRWFPIGEPSARRRLAAIRPTFGVDAQAAYAASLRLALARREREHRVEHLALTLLTLDPGARWVLASLGTDYGRLLDELACAFPPPRRPSVVRGDRRVGRSRRLGAIKRRHQDLSGHINIVDDVLARLITG